MSAGGRAARGARRELASCSRRTLVMPEHSCIRRGPPQHGMRLGCVSSGDGACDVLRGGQMAGISCRNSIATVLGCHHLGGGHTYGLFPNHGLICWCHSGSLSFLKERCTVVALFRFLELVIFIRMRKLYPVVTLPVSALSLSFSQWPYVGLYLGP